MGNIYPAIQVSERVWWVGAIDWHVRDFHGYTTERGTTYNAYLILGDKITLIDTVKAPFRDEMLARIASVVDPASIDVIISQHSELDHSGSLPAVIDRVRPQAIYASAMGAKTLEDLFHGGAPVSIVKDGETLPFGNYSLAFLETRMLHWPDSMISWLPENKVLFSQDAFGMHLATSERFDDEIASDILAYEAATYYANILTPFSPLVTKLLARVAAAGIDPKIIAPDHGPIWRRDLTGILERYGGWAGGAPSRKAVVLYGSMWGSTAAMARAVAEGLAVGGASVKVMSTDVSHRSDVAYEILGAGALLAGSSTLNNHLLPAMADVMTYLKGLKPANLIGGAFGSYGWSGEAPAQLAEMMQQMKIEPMGEPIRTKHVPDAACLDACYAMGASVAARLAEKVPVLLP